MSDDKKHKIKIIQFDGKAEIEFSNTIITEKSGN